MSACARTRLVRDQSMSPLCGLGMTILRPPFHMTKCLPPASGGPQPSARSRRTNSRHLIGFGMRLGIDVDAIDYGQCVSVTKAHDDPGFQCASKLFAAFFERFALAPCALARRDVAKEPAILHQLIMSM